MKNVIKLKLSLCPIYMAVIKDGIFGFDSMYQIEKNGNFFNLNEINLERID